MQGTTTRTLWLGSARVLRGTAALLEALPLLLLVAVLLSPIGPHLLWTYSYAGPDEPAFRTNCVYLGTRGFVRNSRGMGCPRVAIIDHTQTPPVLRSLGSYLK